MHVGLNLVFLVPGAAGGMETYARELIPELVAAAPHHRFTSFVGHDAAAVPGPWSELTGYVTVPVSARNRLEWVRGEQLRLPPLAHRAGIELLHSFASTAPAWGRFRQVVTIHDLIYRTIPRAHPGLRALGMRVLVPLAARSAQRVIAPSESTRSDLESHLGLRPEKIDVVPEGLGAVQQSVALPEAHVRTSLAAGNRSIVLTVSAKLVHKNLERLLGALARLEPVRRPLLVLPGYPTAHERRLRARAAELGIMPDVRFLGWVTPSELEGLYAAATCVVLPSLAEGFGLPVLEAMARGVPVACSGRGALAEVAGDAALTFDPESEESIAAAVARLLSDSGERERLRAAGQERARRFTWQAAARMTLASYARAAGGGGIGPEGAGASA